MTHHITPLAWMEDAACLQYDPESWFPHAGADEQRRQAVAGQRQRACTQCGTEFTVPGTHTYDNKVFCSDACGVANRRAKAAAARQARREDAA